MLARLTALLTRITSSGRMIGEIDGLRFIAIATVVLHHVLYIARDQLSLAPASLGAAVSRFYDLGNVGVPLFFGISGFILALPFAEWTLGGRHPVQLKRYFLRRLTRLEPPYIVNLGALCLLALITHGASRSGRIPHLFASLTYSHNFVYGAWSEINFVAWSLEVEAQFYVMAPLLALVYRVPSNQVRRGAIATLMVACAFLATRSSDVPYAVRMLLPYHLHFFLVGFLVADLYVTRRWRDATTTAAWTDFLATIGLLSVFWFWSHPATKQFAFAGIFVFYASVLRSRVWKRILNLKALVVYGGMCYTVYLYHFWIMRPFVNKVTAPLCAVLPGGAGFLVVGLLTLLFVGLLATIPFLLFEKPFMFPTWPQWVAQRVSARWRGVPPLEAGLDDPN